MLTLLTDTEVDALLAAPILTTWTGQREPDASSSFVVLAVELEPAAQTAVAPR